MSYILDALRKADAQRVRDPGRGIHAQPATASATVPAPRVRREHLLWGAAALLILLAAAWLFAGGREPVQVANAPAPAPQVVIVQPPPAQVPMVPTPATQLLPPAPAVPVVAAPPPAIPVAQVAQPAPPAAPAQAAAPPADRVYAFTELPADVQQAFPKLSISGGVFSENIAQRMLIVNGQVFNEGSEVAPGVVLEQLRPKSAVLRFRGLRISQAY